MFACCAEACSGVASSEDGCGQRNAADEVSCLGMYAICLCQYGAVRRQVFSYAASGGLCFEVQAVVVRATGRH